MKKVEKVSFLEKSKETAESNSCSWELRILKERSSFFEGLDNDIENDFIQKEDISTPFILNLPSRESSDNDNTAYTKRSVNSNSHFTVDPCKTSLCNKENDKECDMNMSSSEPDVTLLCKTNVTNQTSNPQMIKRNNIQEIDHSIGSLRGTNETDIDNKTSDVPTISESLFSTPENKLISSQNQQSLTDNYAESNKMCTDIGDDKVNNSESNKKETRKLVSSFFKDSENKNTNNKVSRSRGIGVTRKVTEDYVL